MLIKQYSNNHNTVIIINNIKVVITCYVSGLLGSLGLQFKCPIHNKKQNPCSEFFKQTTDVSVECSCKVHLSHWVEVFFEEMLYRNKSELQKIPWLYVALAGSLWSLYLILMDKNADGIQNEKAADQEMKGVVRRQSWISPKNDSFTSHYFCSIKMVSKPKSWYLLEIPCM